MQVSMPLSEFESMEAEIKKLRQERLANYFKYEYPTGLENNEPVMVFDQERAIKDIATANRRITTINVKTREGLLIKPIKVNGGDEDAKDN